MIKATTNQFAKFFHCGEENTTFNGWCMISFCHTLKFTCCYTNLAWSFCRPKVLADHALSIW